MTRVQKHDISPNIIGLQCRLELSGGAKRTFLCDSGASVSLLKLGVLPTNALVRRGAFSAHGASGAKIDILGQTFVLMRFGNFEFEHKFWVCRDNLQINTNALLGLDFILSFAASVNSRSMKLEFEQLAIPLEAVDDSGAVVRAVFPASRLSVSKVSYAANLRDDTYPRDIPSLVNDCANTETGRALETVAAVRDGAVPIEHTRAFSKQGQTTDKGDGAQENQEKQEKQVRFVDELPREGNSAVKRLDLPSLSSTNSNNNNNDSCMLVNSVNNGTHCGPDLGIDIPLFLIDAVTIPARTQIAVPVTARKLAGQLQGIYVVESCPQPGYPGLLAENALVNVNKNSNFHILLTNHLREPTHVKRNARVGLLFAVEEEQMPPTLSRPVRCVAHGSGHPDTAITRNQAGEADSHTNGAARSRPAPPKALSDKDICENIKLQHLPPPVRAEFLSIATQYKDIFTLTDENVGLCPHLQHDIPTEEGKTVRRRPYRIPYSQREAYQAEINRLLSLGIIIRSSSDWRSPTIFLYKVLKCGRVKSKIILDARFLNEITTSTVPYRSKRLDEALDFLSGKQYVSTFDVASAFMSIAINPNHTHKLAFEGLRGEVFEFVRGAYGLRELPATFSWAMDITTSGLESVFSYYDDVSVSTRTLRGHIETLQKLFQRLREANLKIRLDKVNILPHKLDFLGFEINTKQQTIRPREEKLQAITDAPIPTDKKALKSFLALCNWMRKHCKNFAFHARDLYHLIKPRVKWEWTAEHTALFEKLKAQLISDETVLHLPDLSKQFSIIVDSSNTGQGAILTQEINGHTRVIAYASRHLKRGEFSRSTIEKELSGVLFALKQWRMYIAGSRVRVHTDHKPICNLQHHEDHGALLTRMISKVLAYDIEWVYTSGVTIPADYLSRLPKRPDTDEPPAADTTHSVLPTCEILAPQPAPPRPVPRRAACDKLLPGHRDGSPAPLHPPRADLRDAEPPRPALRHAMHAHDGSSTPCEGSRSGERRDSYPSKPARVYTVKHEQQIVTVEMTVDAQGNDSECINIMKHLDIFPEFVIHRGALCMRDERGKLALFVPTALRNDVIRQVHEFGHFGLRKTYARLKHQFFFPGMYTHTKHFIRSCKACNARNDSHYISNTPLKASPLPTRPFEGVLFDLIGAINPPSSKNHTHILSLRCMLSGFLILVPLRHTDSVTIRDKIQKHLIERYGTPRFVKSDNAANLNSKVMAEFTQAFQMQHINLLPYSPQNSPLERNHLDVSRIISKLIVDNPRSWHKHVGTTAACINNSIHDDTGYSPFEVIMGREFVFPWGSLPQNEPRPVTKQSYAAALKGRLDSIQREVHAVVTAAKERAHQVKNKNRYARHFNVLDTVWYRCPLAERTHTKFDKPWTGPFLIIAKYNDNSYKIRSCDDPFVEVNTALRKLKPYRAKAVPPSWAARPKPILTRANTRTHTRHRVAWAPLPPSYGAEFLRRQRPNTPDLDHTPPSSPLYHTPPPSPLYYTPPTSPMHASPSLPPPPSSSGMAGQSGRYPDPDLARFFSLCEVPTPAPRTRLSSPRGAQPHNSASADPQASGGEIATGDANAAPATCTTPGLANTAPACSLDYPLDTTAALADANSGASGSGPRPKTDDSPFVYSLSPHLAKDTVDLSGFQPQTAPRLTSGPKGGPQTQLAVQTGQATTSETRELRDPTDTSPPAVENYSLRLRQKGRDQTLAKILQDSLN